MCKFRGKLRTSCLVDFLWRRFVIWRWLLTELRYNISQYTISWEEGVSTWTLSTVTINVIIYTGSQCWPGTVNIANNFSHDPGSYTISRNICVGRCWNQPGVYCASEVCGCIMWCQVTFVGEIMEVVEAQTNVIYKVSLLYARPFTCLVHVCGDQPCETQGYDGWMKILNLIFTSLLSRS